MAMIINIDWYVAVTFATHMAIMIYIVVCSSPVTLVTLLLF